MKRIKGVLLAALLTVTVSMPVYADRSEKVELPQSSTDYYMTVDSGEDGVDIYPSTDKKVENLTELKLKTEQFCILKVKRRKTARTGVIPSIREDMDMCLLMNSGHRRMKSWQQPE